MMDFLPGLQDAIFFLKNTSKERLSQNFCAFFADIHNTAIITPFGLFKFLRLTFGLMIAGITFQRLMDKRLTGLLWCSPT
jgi:hypothetical protein